MYTDLSVSFDNNDPLDLPLMHRDFIPVTSTIKEILDS